MSKKNKKEEEKQEVKTVNTDVDIENAYYNYDEPVVYETKKPGFFKKLFRGKKKVTSSNDLAQEENFYGNYGSTDNSVYENVNIQSEQVNNAPVDNTPPPPPPVVNNNYNKEVKEPKYRQNYDYTQPFEEEPHKQPISKSIGYIIGALLLVGAIVLVMTKFMSSATEKYYINVGTTTIALRPYEGEQITFLTNDSKKTKFVSSDTSIVSVNEFGYVQAKGYKANDNGYLKATITVGGTEINKKIDVYIVPTSVSIPMEDFTVPSNIELKLNEKMLIEISNITPPNNTRQRFDYTSKDTTIADVNGVGIITGRKKGNTTIEVRNHINKNITKIINITVK